MSQPRTDSPSSNKTSPSRHLLPSKVGKNLKKVKRRLSSVFHHVTAPKHPETLPVVTAILPFANVVRNFDSPASLRNKHSESDLTSSRGSSTLSERSSQSSISTTSTTSVEVSSTSKLREDSSIIMSSESIVDDPALGSRVEEIKPSVASTSEPLLFTGLPAIHVEPETPDPFLIEDEDESSSDKDSSVAPITELHQTVILSSSATHSLPLMSPNLNKDVPPPPTSESEQEDEEAPDLYLPGLIIPTMFLPIPNTDPLTTLLTKYIYPPEKRPVRDLTGEWKQSDFHTMVMSNSWRALARMARDRLVASNPEDLTLILGLWYIRLASLARLRLFNQVSAECTNLFVVLNAIEPPETRSWVFDRVLPFELEVMQARLKYWAGDHMGYLDALNVLLRKCKSSARSAKSDTTTASMWKERGARICLIIASQLVEMKDFIAATNLLEPLCEQGGDVSTSALRSSIGRIYLQSGNLKMASKHFTTVAADPVAHQTMKDMNAALLASAKGDWTEASDRLRAILEEDIDNFVAVNNLSVALLGQGKLKEGIEVLENALKSSPSSVVVAEPFLFNLSTLYELRSATTAENKRNLLIEVAKWSGDGLKTTCLKMPTN